MSRAGARDSRVVITQTRVRLPSAGSEWPAAWRAASAKVLIIVSLRRTRDYVIVNINSCQRKEYLRNNIYTKQN